MAHRWLNEKCRCGEFYSIHCTYCNGFWCPRGHRFVKVYVCDNEEGVSYGTRCVHFDRLETWNEEWEKEEPLSASKILEIQVLAGEHVEEKEKKK